MLKYVKEILKVKDLDFVNLKRDRKFRNFES